MPERQRARYANWLRAAAVYNAAWGAANVLMPGRMFRALGMPDPEPPAAWQTVGMMVAVYAPAYWWASRDPVEHSHVVAVGLLGKLLGPGGFVWAVKTGRLPLRFGRTLLTNDVVWWPVFAAIVRDGVSAAGGWEAYLRGPISPAAARS